MEFKDQVLNIIAEVCQDDIVKEDPQIELFEEGILDSFGVVNLLLEFEEQLGITIPISDFDRDEWNTPHLIIKKLDELR
ncbi:D-alanine--poly(phosphoribitol) ligase subunit DltC [Bacillus aquiflavi]|uniref:D-alanyl carrier protein n=1 Tax=Bacillus aquiflavi TaxID=2672567 RepID=A0A6B3W1D2_9BACI|nr:D-alanine--poly(phosphoribitol) ligase subunit DltC [Bacillus aquiflavi]MBA4537526.1 D-alanine--poly(phosphoribitol) ligase subunit DltC [Bacillus aquiflavi]NEY81783.1 D-alanine--poly(phosphoribitol) ligase subunit DltC [Bacillus aquiflavi]UAC47853.1 D-alanine--poly(phosphoribitol) ligase subunit DltC [Bacillus aquiflavi]